MKKHYRVFLSSTYKKLVKERMEILAYISSTQGIPFGMEYFPSDDAGAEKVIRQFIQQCDMFCVIGHEEIGSRKREDDQTWVEWELKLAISLGKKVIALFPDAPFEQKERLCSILEEPRVLFKEYAFRKDSVRPSLYGAFTQSYHDARDALEKDPVSGLVSLATLDDGTPVAAEKVRQVLLSPLLKRATGHLIEPRRILQRVRENEHEREFAGKTLWRYGNFFGEERRTSTIFFDGGASTLFAIYRLFRRLKNTRTYANNEGQPDLTILTNSPFCFELACQLANELNVDVKDIRLVPQTGYNDAYGIYLAEAQLGEHPSADEIWQNDSWASLPDENFDLCQFDGVDENTLIVSSVSGFSPFTARSGSQKGHEVHSGPWVRSYPNLQFKRCLVKSGLRTVFMLDSKKWMRGVEERKSLFLFGDSSEELIQQGNVAYCLGTSEESQGASLRSHFKEGWQTYGHDDDELIDYDGKLFGVLAMPVGFSPRVVNQSGKSRPKSVLRGG